MIDFKKQLDEAQYRAVAYTEGPELVIAGAGSGKTRVLTYKIAYLIEKGMQPSRIIALTFTNKAAREMKNRISTLVGDGAAKQILAGTFHSIFAKILRNELNKRSGILPYKSNFTICDKDDSEAYIKKAVENLGLDLGDYKPDRVAERISMAKNRMITPDQYPSSRMATEDKKNKKEKTGEIYKEYNLLLKKSNLMDFDDLLLNTYLLFRDNDDSRKRYSLYYQYCLVDEYQDTNLVQKSILLQLTKENNRVCAVGDDAQSIYAFRGADIGNILHFEEDFPGMVTFKLEQNYRSTKTLVKAANSIISKNRFQIQKELYSNNEEGSKIYMLRGGTGDEEARSVVGIIKGLVNQKKYNFGDFAILYRSNWLSATFENELRRERIPYKLYAGTSFYQRKEVKDLLAYCRVIVNEDDEQSLRRIINYPSRGIGDTTVSRLKTISRLNGMTMWNVTGSSMYLNSLTKGAANKVLEFARQLRTWQRYQSEDAYSLASRIFEESGIKKLLLNFGKEGNEDRYNNIQELLSSIKNFVEDRKKEGNTAVSLADYIREVTLLTDEDDKNENVNTQRVKLMTIHASKGLEFPVVFIVGMNEDIFPSKQSAESPAACEEERRLCYVAITRAREKCFMTLAGCRFRNGSYLPYEKSRFLDDIDRRYKDVI